MTIWAKIANFETTAKNSVLRRCWQAARIKYGKKIQKFDREVCLEPKSEKPVNYLWQISAPRPV